MRKTTVVAALVAAMLTVSGCVAVTKLLEGAQLYASWAIACEGTDNPRRCIEANAWSWAVSQGRETEAADILAAALAWMRSRENFAELGLVAESEAVSGDDGQHGNCIGTTIAELRLNHAWTQRPTGKGIARLFMRCYPDRVRFSVTDLEWRMQELRVAPGADIFDGCDERRRGTVPSYCETPSAEAARAGVMLREMRYPARGVAHALASESSEAPTADEMQAAWAYLMALKSPWIHGPRSHERMADQLRLPR